MMMNKVASYKSDILFSIIDECFNDILGVDIDFLRTNSRETDYVYPRMIYARVCLKRGISLTQIGKRLNRNHSTISSYLKKYDDYYKYDLYFKKLADDIMKKYKQKTEKRVRRSGQCIIRKRLHRFAWKAPDMGGDSQSGSACRNAVFDDARRKRHRLCRGAGRKNASAAP